jgi:hypothetical protein
VEKTKYVIEYKELKMGKMFELLKEGLEDIIEYPA